MSRHRKPPPLPALPAVPPPVLAQAPARYPHPWTRAFLLLAIMEALAIAGLSLQVYYRSEQVAVLEEARVLDAEYRTLALRYAAIHERGAVACQTSLARMLDKMGVREGPAVDMMSVWTGRPVLLHGVGGE